jgi:hypothetical protein
MHKSVINLKENEYDYLALRNLSKTTLTRASMRLLGSILTPHRVMGEVLASAFSSYDFSRISGILVCAQVRHKCQTKSESTHTRNSLKAFHSGSENFFVRAFCGSSSFGGFFSAEPLFLDSVVGTALSTSAVGFAPDSCGF